LPGEGGAERIADHGWPARRSREGGRRAGRGQRPEDVQTHLYRSRGRGRLDPRELRTTFVSLLSHQGVSIEEIARLAGHASTRTTEIVYRRELRPVITTGAEIMDELFRPS
jgi:integrase